jgi:hypothetical protein
MLVLQCNKGVAGILWLQWSAHRIVSHLSNGETDSSSRAAMSEANSMITGNVLPQEISSQATRSPPPASFLALEMLEISRRILNPSPLSLTSLN